MRILRLAGMLLEGSVTANAVYVVDDDASFRDSLVSLLEVNGFASKEFSSADEAIERLPDLDPGVMFLDLRLGSRDGREVLAAAAGQQCQLSFVIMTGHGDVDSAVASMKLGASDFLEKPFSEGAMLAALRQARSAISSRLQRKASVVHATTALLSLTPRERETILLLLQGASNKEVARNLGISSRTIEVYRAAACRKLGVRNVAEAASRFGSSISSMTEADGQEGRV